MPIKEENRLFTIGCSSFSVEHLINRLKKYGINVVVDVRSVPYSHYTPQFNADVLKSVLWQQHIAYRDFSKEFGARRIEKDAYVQNCVDFKKVMELPAFLHGVDRIKAGLASNFRIALMCTEKDPARCHRFSLVARGIEKKINVHSIHILQDGTVLSKEAIESRLIQNMNIVDDFFIKKTPLELLYEKLERQVAYTMNKRNEDELY